MAKKKRARLTVLEAVDHLSHLAEIDSKTTEWREPSKLEENQETIRQTFLTLTHYLQHLYQKERQELENPQTQKGLQAMMQLAGEAVERVGQYTHLFKGAHDHAEAIPEFKQLQQFYFSKVFSRVKKEKAQEAWEHEGSEILEEMQALKDLESVQLDDEYELFYIAREDGTPFYSPHLLRHIRMVGNFDESLLPEGEADVLKQMDGILDRDFHHSAQEILSEGSHLLEKFCKESFHHKEVDGVAALTKAVMALMLASNPKNLIHNTEGKSCGDYFVDFELYLRRVIESDDYDKWRGSNREALSSFKASCLKLTHYLCHCLFLRSGARQGVLTLVKELAEHRAHELSSLWGSLASVEVAIRQSLRRYPSGPLMKILKVFRHEEEKKGFDPLLQGNAPSALFSISSESLHTTIIHLPCPIHQDFIDRVAIAPEFKGYLRSLGEQKQLYINLQDKTSWKEHARSHAIEELSTKGEFSHVLNVVTFAKNTDFYHQINDYAEMGQSDAFCAACKDQVIGGVQTGFYLPAALLTPQRIEEVVTFVHEQFFETKPHLTRKERLDFIEIFYFFLTLLIASHVKPDVLNFSCKDGVDTGAAMVATFYGFSRMLSSTKPWSEEDKNFFLYAFFGSPFLVRHRTISTPVFQRALSALDYFEGVIQGRRDKLLAACAALLPELPLIQMRVA